MIQQGLNQLLTSTAYFMQPIGERRRDEKAFQMAQQEADKRTDTILEALGDRTGRGETVSDEQIEYAENLNVNQQKAMFERNPTQENLEKWHQAIMSKEDQMRTIAESNWQENAIQQIKQDIKFDKLKRQLRKEAGLD